MSSQDKSESLKDLLKQVEELCYKVQLGIASSEEAELLNKLLKQHEECREHVCSILIDEAMLQSELRILGTKRQFLWDDVAGAMANVPSVPEAAKETQLPAAVSQAFCVADSAMQSGETYLPVRSGSETKRRIGYFSSFIAGALLAVAAISMLWQPEQPKSPSALVDNSKPDTTQTITQVAHVVRTTGILWSDRQGRRVTPGSALATGDTIRLSSGVGLLEFESGLTLYMEGPAEVDISSFSGVAVRHGRVCVRVSSESNGQHVQTSLSTLQLSPSALIGISSNGSVLEVHAFAGAVEVYPDPIFSCPDTFNVAESTALRFDVSHTGSLRAWDCLLSREKFASLAHVDSDQLYVSDEYVETILKAKPILYWRFEDVEDGLALDEANGKRNCRFRGGARLAAQKPSPADGSVNHVLDIGFGSAHGSVISTETINQLSGDSYMVEMWVRPTHYHHGVLMSLLDNEVRRPGVVSHGAILELRNALSDTQAVRFMHRTPVGASGGTDCYSRTAYSSGVWQHLAAVKSGGEMQLYINGSLVCVGENTTPIDSPLSLLIGQLYPKEPVRPFVGQLDELAIYDYAVSSDEIASRSNLLNAQ